MNTEYINTEHVLKIIDDNLEDVKKTVSSLDLDSYNFESVLDKCLEVGMNEEAFIIYKKHVEESIKKEGSIFGVKNWINKCFLKSVEHAKGWEFLEKLILDFNHEKTIWGTSEKEKAIIKDSLILELFHHFLDKDNENNKMWQDALIKWMKQKKPEFKNDENKKPAKEDIPYPLISDERNEKNNYRLTLKFLSEVDLEEDYFNIYQNYILENANNMLMTYYKDDNWNNYLYDFFSHPNVKKAIKDQSFDLLIDNICHVGFTMEEKSHKQIEIFDKCMEKEIFNVAKKMLKDTDSCLKMISTTCYSFKFQSDLFIKYINKFLFKPNELINHMVDDENSASVVDCFTINHQLKHMSFSGGVDIIKEVKKKTGFNKYIEIVKNDNGKKFSHLHVALNNIEIKENVNNNKVKRVKKI